MWRSTTIVLRGARRRCPRHAGGRRLLAMAPVPFAADVVSSDARSGVGSDTACVEMAWRESLPQLVRAGERGHGVAVERLLASGSDPNEPDELGWSALDAAAVGDHPAVVAMLLRAGAPVEIRDAKGFTSLLNACSAGPEMIERLLAGAPTRWRETSGSVGGRWIASPRTPTSRGSDSCSQQARELTCLGARLWAMPQKQVVCSASSCSWAPAPTRRRPGMASLPPHSPPSTGITTSPAD